MTMLLWRSVNDQEVTWDNVFTKGCKWIFIFCPSKPKTEKVIEIARKSGVRSDFTVYVI